MLVLRRRFNESLRVGDDVTVTILGSKGNSVQIGVAAPRAIAVHRGEVYERVQADFASNPQSALEGMDRAPRAK